MKMARKEMVYTVSKETNTIIRVSNSFLNSANFAATLKFGTYYICTSEFANLKKGEHISNIVDFLA
jgi:hypothetical protein